MPEFIAHSPKDATTPRVGPGRWAVALTPCPGILWTNDTDAVGFLPVGKVNDTVFDSTNIDEQIQANIDAGRSVTVAFDLIAALVGKSIHTGDLTTWRAQPVRPKLVKPEISRGEIIEQAQADGAAQVSQIVESVQSQVTAQIDNLVVAVQAGQSIKVVVEDAQ